MNQWTDLSGKKASLVTVFQRPFSAAIFIVWFIAIRYTSPTPFLIKQLFSILILIPIIRLIQPVIPAGMMIRIYAICALYSADIVRGVLGGIEMIEQALLLTEGLTGIVLLWWWLVSRSLEQVVDNKADSGTIKLIEWGYRIAIFYLGVGLVAVTIGYTNLGRIIIPGTISAIILALEIYLCVRILGGAVSIALRIRPLRMLLIVNRHRDLLENRIYLLFIGLAIIAWTIRTLDHVGLLSTVASMGMAVLNTKMEKGAISISIGDILAFGVAIFASYILSRLICFALQEEVFPRGNVPMGTAYASSRLFHYTIMSLGFAIGLGLLGVDLTKISIMAGALGVGIGFGLQSVVNNFVCGLILLFERPIHVGDLIEVGGLLGTVRQIGFRASAVRTQQGADIIVPNAQFITANVTNWTYSDKLRRMDLPIGVNYASSPNRVIELLEAVAHANPNIKRNPKPICLFIGYGDSSINFELRAWTDHFADYPRIRSELNSAIYDAVHTAEMSFPFPQREIRILKAT